MQQHAYNRHVCLKSETLCTTCLLITRIWLGQIRTVLPVSSSPVWNSQIGVSVRNHVRNCRDLARHTSAFDVPPSPVSAAESTNAATKHNDAHRAIPRQAATATSALASMLTLQRLLSANRQMMAVGPLRIDPYRPAVEVRDKHRL